MKRKYINFVLILIIGILIGFGIQQREISYPLNYSRAQVYLPAVDDKGNGVVTLLSVEIRPGDGKVLTNIDKLLFWVDTQYSIQTAKSVAEDVTGISIKNVDLTYTIKSGNATIIGGPSAGAALTIATIAVLENKSLRKDVMITGTINEDGTIGEVGAILEKAKAAKEIGATLFLVPMGQSIQTYLKPEEKCIKKIGFIYCETTYKEINVNIGDSANISVIEVEDINDAIKYFLT
ncbi:MAG: S16 family serine protease [Candidatus Aenigmatarchaeota archaeon]